MSRPSFAFAFVSCLVLAACSGNTAFIGGDDGGDGGGTGDGGTGDSAAPPDGSPGGDCPASVPNQGDPCTTIGLSCEYGGVGPHLLCATTATCNGAIGKNSWFVSAPGKDCVSSPQQNPGSCPSSFGAVPTGSKCPGGLNGSSCVYDEGMCGCIPCVTQPPSGGSQEEWACEAYPQPAGCPEPQPRIGSPCTQEGQTCAYGAICSVLGQLPTLGCQSGRWSLVPVAAACQIHTCGK